MAEAVPRAHAPDHDLVRHRDLTVAGEWLDRLTAAGLDSLDAIFAASNTDALSKPGLDPWRERLSVELPAGPDRTRPQVGRPAPVVYIKRFTRPPRSAAREVRRARCGARSLAGLEWTWLRAFRKQGISAAAPIALGEEIRRGVELRSAVLIAAVPGESLESLLDHRTTDRQPDLPALSPHLARLIALMHGSGFVHRDLYLAHIFFGPHAPLPESLRLIDLQRVLRPKWFPSRWVVKDLAALNYSTPASAASRSDRFRWLLRYLTERGTDRGDVRRSARRLAYRVLGKTAQIARHDRARIHRLKSAGR